MVKLKIKSLGRSRKRSADKETKISEQVNESEKTKNKDKSRKERKSTKGSFSKSKKDSPTVHESLASKFRKFFKFNKSKDSKASKARNFTAGTNITPEKISVTENQLSKVNEKELTNKSTSKSKLSSLGSRSTIQTTTAQANKENPNETMSKSYSNTIGSYNVKSSTSTESKYNYKGDKQSPITDRKIQWIESKVSDKVLINKSKSKSSNNTDVSTRSNAKSSSVTQLTKICESAEGRLSKSETELCRAESEHVYTFASKLQKIVTDVIWGSSVKVKSNSKLSSHESHSTTVHTTTAQSNREKETEFKSTKSNGKMSSSTENCKDVLSKQSTKINHKSNVATSTSSKLADTGGSKKKGRKSIPPYPNKESILSAMLAGRSTERVKGSRLEVLFTDYDSYSRTTYDSSTQITSSGMEIYSKSEHSPSDREIHKSKAQANSIEKNKHHTKDSEQFDDVLLSSESKSRTSSDDDLSVKPKPTKSNSETKSEKLDAKSVSNTNNTNPSKIPLTQLLKPHGKTMLLAPSASTTKVELKPWFGSLLQFIPGIETKRNETSESSEHTKSNKESNQTCNTTSEDIIKEKPSLNNLISSIKRQLKKQKKANDKEDAEFELILGTKTDWKSKSNTQLNWLESDDVASIEEEYKRKWFIQRKERIQQTNVEEDPCERDSTNDIDSFEENYQRKKRYIRKENEKRWVREALDEEGLTDLMRQNIDSTQKVKVLKRELLNKYDIDSAVSSTSSTEDGSSREKINNPRRVVCSDMTAVNKKRDEIRQSHYFSRVSNSKQPDPSQQTSAHNDDDRPPRRMKQSHSRKDAYWIAKDPDR